MTNVEIHKVDLTKIKTTKRQNQSNRSIGLTKAMRSLNVGEAFYLQEGWRRTSAPQIAAQIGIKVVTRKQKSTSKIAVIRIE